MAARDVLLMADPAVREVERIFKWKILVDDKALEECAIKAEETLGNIQGIPFPNTFKIAGHYAFWIRKLKPFSLYCRAETVALLKELGVAQADALVPPHNAPAGSRTLFVNEIIAIFVALGLMTHYRAKSQPARISPEMMNDWIVGLRYHSYFPSSLAILLEGLAQCQPAVAPG